MKHLVWLLFLPGLLCNSNPMTIRPDSLVTWKGSCVVIPCQIGQYGGVDLREISLLWYFLPHYDSNRTDYTGILLYNSSATPNTQSRFASELQVDFIRDIKQKKCSLKISPVGTEHNGMYGARMFASYSSGGKQVKEKWFVNATVKVAESPPKPTMDISPTDITASITSSITVTCSVLHHCPSTSLRMTVSGLKTYGWSSPTTTIQDGVIKTVATFPVTSEDHGKTLVCLLEQQQSPKSYWSEISRSAMQLDVKYAPKGVQLTALSATTLREGAELSLDCVTESSNPAVSEYRWYKDDQQLYQWQVRKLTELKVKGDQHSGVYRCEAQNSVGSQTSERIHIDVQYLPKEVKVDQQPQGPIQEGQRLVLQCSSKANPPITRYEWYKQPQTAIVETGNKLQFDSIRLGDAGTYYCIARNSIGNLKSSPVVLDVLYAPKGVRLIFENYQLPIKERDTFTLNCSFNQSNPSDGIRYKWYKASSALSHQGNLLTFNSATLEEAGDYRCEVCNDVSCGASPSVTVDIHFAPKDVKVVQEPGTQIDEGNRVTLRCEVAKANPEVSSYRWYKDGVQQGPDSASLTIYRVTPEHSGRYWCDAQNSVAVSFSEETTLNVHYGPRKVRLSLQTRGDVTEGMDVTLRCDADANPPPKRFEFYRDKGKILEKWDQVLILRKVQVEDVGVYSCKAVNSISAAESETLSLAVSYSRATKLKHGLTGLGILLGLIMLLGVLTFILKAWKKKCSSGAAQTQRSGSFFMRKPKPNNLCNNRPHEGAVNSLAFLNRDAEEEGVSYATLRFPPRVSEEQDDYARVQAPRLVLDPSKEEAVYSVVKKPSKGDSKHDYENVMAKKEEELHYSSLVNLAPRPRPAYRDSETDSESEESIQYAALKH